MKFESKIWDFILIKYIKKYIMLKFALSSILMRESPCMHIYIL